MRGAKTSGLQGLVPNTPVASETPRPFLEGPEKGEDDRRPLGGLGVGRRRSEVRDGGYSAPEEGRTQV